MKLYGAVCIAVAVIMLLAPIAALPFGKSENNAETEMTEQAQKPLSVQTQADTHNDDYVSVFMTQENEARTLSMRDYIIGVVASEVPASYEEEAVKAQALVAVTYTRYRQMLGSDPTMDSAVISDDSSRHQGYISKEEMQTKWGEAFDAYYEKICDAVDSVIDEVITYDGEPIMAAYHAISAGRTESAENVWGKNVAYLCSVDSSWDEDSTRFDSEVVFSRQELAELFEKDYADVYVKTKDVSDAGTVLEIDMCGEIMSGSQVRELLGLRSPAFTVEKDGDEYIFSVKGYGHGVGMSQNGANCMAQNGYDYKEIISHYYSGVEIEKEM